MAVQKSKERAQTASNVKEPNAAHPPIVLHAFESPEYWPSGSELCVVGIGASAGGLEALQELLTHLPGGCRLSFVVIQYLSTRYKSAMEQLLAHTIALPIVQIKNNLRIKPGQIYLNPPDQFVSMNNDKFEITPPQLPGSGVSLPINFFFTSLAHTMGQKAICVILSGSASDGTQGLKAVKAAGGLTFAQSPHNAKYSGMPDSAIATRMVDFVLPAKAIAEKLADIFKHPCNNYNGMPPPDEREMGANLRQVLAILQSKTGHDFSNYKTTTVHRRIARRMAVHQLHRLADYVRLMVTDPAEPSRLLKDMLIGATRFFRDQDAFEALKEKVMVPLIRSKKTSDRFRVWVAGCSSGEEAYSIAILLAEAMEQVGIQLAVQIFASDIDNDAIHTSRTGVYPQNIASDVSNQRLARFFTHTNDTFKVKKTIRNNIVYSNHNLIKDPPFSKIDLITCRNLLIYLKPDLQKRILPLFHYALKPTGYLFLGLSETIGDCSDRFAVVSLKHKIFRHREVVPADQYSIRHMPPSVAGGGLEIISDEKGRTPPSDIYAHAERIIIDEYAPPGVLIDKNLEILQFFGQTDPFLRTPRGKASFSLFKMVREGLAFKLDQSIRRAIRSGKPEKADNVSIKTPEGLIRAQVTVRPLLERPGGRELFIVLFEIMDTVESVTKASALVNQADIAIPSVVKLRDELYSNKAYLQTIIRELEASNEKYMAANEELQSVNEELQSTNEALETSCEELQSTNEELVTVNSEHQLKIEEMTKSSNDIYSLLEISEIASLFLDLNLCVRGFTPAITRIIDLRQTDLGRSIRDITNRLQTADIHASARKVIDTLQRQKMEVRDKKGRWYEMRVLPYRTTDNVIDGVTIAFFDITALQQVHRLQRVTVAFDNSSDAAMIQDFAGTILSWNRTAETLYGWTEKEAVGMHVTKITAEKDRYASAAVARRLQRGENVESIEIQRITKSGTRLTVQLYATALLDAGQRPVKIATFERPVNIRSTK